MLIVLDCPGCGKRYEIDAALAGKKSRCKHCGEVFKIPVPTAVAAPPPTNKPVRPAHAASGAGEWQTALVGQQRAEKPGHGAGPARSSSSSAASSSRTIILNCPNCRKRYELDEALAGKKSRCKDCGEVFSIPVPRGRASDVSQSPSRSAAPPSAPVWEAVLEDEPTSFKASRGPSSPAVRRVRSACLRRARGLSPADPKDERALSSPGERRRMSDSPSCWRLPCEKLALAGRGRIS